MSVARFLARLISAQERWTVPFGDFNHRWVSALFRLLGPIKDLLNGRWLGHPLHPALTDIPIGAYLVAIVLDAVGQETGAFWATLVGAVAFYAASAAGFADFADADGRTRSRAALHGLVMIVGGFLVTLSLFARLDGTGGPIALGLLVAGFAVIIAGAFVGGDVVFVLGSMVSRHAFRGAGTKWIRLDAGDVADLAAMPEGTPVKARAGINDLVLVRIGDTTHALHAVCAHAGGPLEKGTVVDGCLECPWHGARYRLIDGEVVRGPSVYDQPAYEVRAADAGGYEVRRIVV